jgi:hypothetical protein
MSVESGMKYPSIGQDCVVRCWLAVQRFPGVADIVTAELHLPEDAGCLADSFTQ